MAPKNPAVQKRLAEALRQNLRRRKEAGRARAKPEQTDKAGTRSDASPDGPESAPKPDQ
jgi:hypothetical protein